MAVDITPTLNQITALPLQDQLDLLHQAWDRLLDSGWRLELSEEQKTELDRRLDDLDANPQNAVSLDKVIAQMRRVR